MIELDQIYDDGSRERVNVLESEALCASPIACAVADAWATSLDEATRYPRIQKDLGQLRGDLCDSLDALESATRDSPLRKVRP